MIRYQLLGFFIAALVVGYLIYRRHFYEKDDGDQLEEEDDNDK
ncbi:MAG TPA: hypothetical protein VMW01_09875 [Williamwhitmania sp.]|nr:hypothetical protein [Williamwhitmania sp.]